MDNIKEIQLPEYFELDKIENGKIILKKINPIDRLPNTWEEYCKDYPNILEEYFINENCAIRKVSTKYSRNWCSDKNLLPLKEYCEAIIALMQLINLRDCYRMGWKPEVGKPRYYVDFLYNSITESADCSRDAIFSFQSSEIRDKFINNFKDLLEQIKLLFE